MPLNQPRELAEIEKYTTCRSAECGARIFFATSTITHNLMPIDADPVPEGNVVLTRGGRYPLVMVFAEGAGPTGVPRYVAHFATCPASESWRRRK